MNKTNNKNKKIVIGIILILIFAACFIPNPEKADYNAKYQLQLISAYDDNEAYHPKVLNFKEKWNGYRYWMSYTPYPQGDDTKENPHIAASNDLINWEIPKGLKNPLDTPDETVPQKRYNSDSHIVYNNDLDRLECYWRYVDDKEDKVIIYRCCTNDGINWTKKEISAVGNPRKTHDYVSPAILYENGLYKMWYVDKKNVLKYTVSKDGLQWGEDKVIKLNYEDKVKTWHLDVIHTNEKYEMIVVAFYNWKTRNEMNLYYSSSEDGIKWEKAKTILKPTSQTEYWDNRGIYRSSFIYENGMYYVFYSGTSRDYHHGIGMVYGKDIKRLKPVKTNYRNKEEVKKLKRQLKIKEI